MLDVVISVIVGLVGGGIGGLLGVGGGIVFVPALVILLDTEQVTAQGVSLAVVVFTAAVAVTQHRRHETINYTVAQWMIVPAVVFGFAGAILAGELGDEWLRRVFGVVAVVVAVRTALSTWRGRLAPTTIDSES